MGETLEKENKELKQRLALYEEIMDHVLQGICICDNKENVVWFNDTVQVNEGVLRDNAIGKTPDIAWQNLEIPTGSADFLLETEEQTKEEVITYTDKKTGKTFTVFRCSYPFYTEAELKYVFSVSYYIGYSEKQINQINAYKKRYIDNNTEIMNNTCNDFRNIVGKSAVIREMIKRAKKIAATDTPVILCGPNGAGKKIFAQGIHNASPRKNGKFVAVNCAAIPAEILETMLFGTTANEDANTDDKKGLLEESNGGTLFLNGIESMPFPLQEKLLKVLQEKQACRFGSNQPYELNCRFLSATDQDPQQLVADGLLRSDLYFQLAVLTLDLPHLCTRENDVIDLTKHFIDKYNKEYHLAIMKATPEVYQLFLKYDWPGNVRELKNVITYVMSTAAVNQTIINYHDLPSYLKEYHETSMRTSRLHLLKNEKSLHDILDLTEKELVSSVLKETGWNISKSAKILDIHREALYYRIKKFNITKQ
jgi:arginine utilization regulatory protein